MCDPTIPTSPSAANLFGCPRWCDPRCCTATLADTEHASAPSRLDTSDDQMIEGALIRRDGHESFDEPGEPCLRVDLTNMRLVGSDVQFTVAVQDLPRIARWLLAEYERAVFAAADRADGVR